jgi:hypothetical protein
MLNDTDQKDPDFFPFPDAGVKGMNWLEQAKK